MPAMGGPQLVEELKKRLYDFKYQFMSGYAHGIAGYEAELNHLQKPFSIGELADAVRSALDGS